MLPGFLLSKVVIPACANAPAPLKGREFDSNLEGKNALPKHKKATLLKECCSN